MIIEIKNLIKRYGNKLAVDNMNLTIRKGEILGLLGPNGAGKTTLINSIIGITEIQSGHVNIFGKSMKDDALEIKNRIGVVPQNLALFNEFTAVENVTYFGKLYGLTGNKLKESVREALEFTNLWERRKDYPKKYSGGMQRRLNIACSIVHKPELIIMDEPTVGIDPQSRNHIMESIRKLNEMGSTIIYTSHYMEEVESLCTRVAIMDNRREYVINTPMTPYPWINYLGNQDFFGIISNTSGGYCFYKDARLRRLTRYRYNNVPIDDGGRYFYINDGGDFWSHSWKPVKKELSFYECRQGLGYTQIIGERNGIRVTQLAFVPLDFNGEVHRITVKNTSDNIKDISLFSFVEFCLWDANDDTTNFQRNFSTGEVEIDGSVIYHKTEYRERRDHYSFYSVNRGVDGFDTDRESFLGLYNGFDAPQVVAANKSGNSVASGWSPVASHNIKLSLNPGEEQSLIFILGYVENPRDQKWESKGVVNKTKAREMIASYASDEAVDRGLNTLRSYWDSLLSHYSLKSSDEKLDRMVNIWNQYQCMVTFNMSRSASYFESGIGRGMGFRDSNQDLLGFVHQIPERARERILDIAATQFEDGGAYHQYQPLTKKGNNDVGGGFNDDPLWLIIAVVAYIKETGDTAILDEMVSYDCDENNKGSLFTHLRASFDHVINNLGPHRLPLIGRADWNDCLNLNCFSTEPGESFQTCGNKDGRVAESVLIAGLFVYAGDQYIELCKQMGNVGEAERAKSHVDEMRRTIMESGYDGEWFLRAYDDFGDKIGSMENAEGQIFIETQGFCIMAGVGAEGGYAEKALNAVIERLDTKYGIVLNNPAYTEYHTELGEISSYPEGYKENAGIFCHNNPWIACAETVLGRGDRAFEVYRKIAPSYLEDISDIHRTEPYVYSQMIAGKDAVRHGEAKNSWLTGTAAWNFAAISQWILGIKPEYNGLQIDPCIPSSWDGYEIKRLFRDTQYNIRIENPSHVCKGVKSLMVDGNKIEGNILPIFSDKKEHSVLAILGQ